MHGVNVAWGYIIIYEDKVFLQIAGFTGDRHLIPRSRFRVDVFSYDERKKEETVVCPPEIVLDRPFKNKIYFIFRRNLTELKLKGQGRTVGTARQALNKK